GGAAERASGAPAALASAGRTPEAPPGRRPSREATARRQTSTLRLPIPAASEGSGLHDERPPAGRGDRYRPLLESPALVVPALVVPPLRDAATADRSASSRPLDNRAQAPSRTKRAHLDERSTPAGDGADFGHRAFLHIQQGQHQAVLRRQPGQKQIDQLSRSERVVDRW